MPVIPREGRSVYETQETWSCMDSERHAGTCGARLDWIGTGRRSELFWLLPGERRERIWRDSEPDANAAALQPRHRGRIECDSGVARLDHSQPELRHVPQCQCSCGTDRAAQRHFPGSSTRISELAAGPAAILNH